MNRDITPYSDRVQSGREQQYGEFVGLLARHDATLRRFIRSMLPSRDGVDDVMQETALECWKKYDQFAAGSSSDVAGEFARWACVIARYKALSWQRDRSRDRLVFRESVIERLASAALDMVGQEERQRLAVEACLQELPADHRRLVLSVYAPDDSIARIAQETGEQARRLYSRVNAIRRQLLDCLRGRLVGEVTRG